MERKKRGAHPPGVGGQDGKISRSLKAHYKEKPRTAEHNQKIAEGQKRAHEQRKKREGK